MTGSYSNPASRPSTTPRTARSTSPAAARAVSRPRSAFSVGSAWLAAVNVAWWPTVGAVPESNARRNVTMSSLVELGQLTNCDRLMNALKVSTAPSCVKPKPDFCGPGARMKPSLR